MSQKSGDRATQELREQIDTEVLDTAEAAGVNVDDVLASQQAEYDDYGPATVARFASSELQNLIEAEQADELKGILMGSRDRYGKTWPRRHSLLRSSGDHIEVSTWDGSLPGPDGTETRIPAGGAIVSMRCEYDSDYDSYEGKRLESVNSLKSEEMATKVEKVAVPPNALNKNDEYNVVAVEGTIEFINPQTIFEDGEPKEDGEVLVPDKRGNAQPHFEVVLRRDESTVVRGHVERQRFAQPYFDVPDLEKLCSDAAELDTPDSQAGFLRNGLNGVRVILVGNVNSYDKNRSDDGVMKYVDIGLTAMVAADMPEESASAESEAEPDADPTPSPNAPTPDAVESESEPDADDSGKDIADVREQIEQYAGLVGEDIEEMTVEDVNEAMELDAPDVVIRQALKGNDSSQAESADDEGAEEPVERLKQGGTYHCPGEDCVASAGSPGELYGHVGEKHKPEVPPKEWIAERVN